jgi:intracellular septation protein A
MSRSVAIAKFVLFEFGPLAVFWALSLAAGVKVAIVGAIVTIFVDAAWRLWRALAFTRLYKLASGLTLAFGVVDLMSAQPFLLKYEAVVTNLVVGAAFVYGAFGEKPMMQEVSEQRSGEAFPDSAEVRRFFQLFTLVWAAYFDLKAALFFVFAWSMPMTEAMAWRSLVGGVSLGLMIALSVTQTRNIFFLMRRQGWLPAREFGDGARA